MGMRRRALAVGLALALCTGAVAVGPATAGAAQTGLTTFVAKRPGLQIRIKVLRHQIRFTELGAAMVCKGTRAAAGDVGIREWGTFGFGIKRSGRFAKQEFEHFGGSGELFWRLEGEVRRNRMVGEYTAWDEHFKAGKSVSRCGTRSPRGLPIRFVAHRVSGPRWQR